MNSKSIPLRWFNIKSSLNVMNPIGMFNSVLKNDARRAKKNAPPLIL